MTDAPPPAGDGLSRANLAVGIAALATGMSGAGAWLLPGAGVLALAGALAVSAVACGYLWHALRAALRDNAGLRARLAEIADTDPLTGLGHRRTLNRDLAGRVAGGGRPFVLMLLDLDGFGLVNERHGHGAGDELLRQVGRRLKEVAGPDGCAYRLGADGFAVVAHADAERSPDVAATALLAAFAMPFRIGGLSLRVGASLGMAQWPQDGGTLEELFVNADAALFAARSEREAPPEPRQFPRLRAIG